MQYTFLFFFCPFFCLCLSFAQKTSTNELVSNAVWELFCPFSYGGPAFVLLAAIHLCFCISFPLLLIFSHSFPLTLSLSCCVFVCGKHSLFRASSWENDAFPPYTNLVQTFLFLAGRWLLHNSFPFFSLALPLFLSLSRLIIVAVITMIVIVCSF